MRRAGGRIGFGGGCVRASDALYGGGLQSSGANGATGRRRRRTSARVQYVWRGSGADVFRRATAACDWLKVDAGRDLSWLRGSAAKTGGPALGRGGRGELIRAVAAGQSATGADAV